MWKSKFNLLRVSDMKRLVEVATLLLSS